MNRASRQALQVVFAILLLLAGGAAWWWYSRPVLKLYIWDGYFPDDVLREFSRTYQVRTKVTLYRNNREMLARVKVSWAEFDVVMPSSYMIEQMRRRKLLVRMTEEDVPNMRYLQEVFLNGTLSDRESVSYGIPYMLNYAGIGYNKAAVPNPPRSWREFFSRDTTARYGKRVLVLNEARETLGLVLMSLGYSPNTRNEAQLERARDVLRAHRDAGPPTMVLADGRERLLDGRGVILQTWSPEITLAQDDHREDIGYVMPEEGSLLTVDTLAIPQSSNQVELAKAFINFALRPDIAARVTDYSRYANALNEKVDKVSPEMRTTPSYAAPTTEKIRFLTDVGDAQHLYDVAWADYTKNSIDDSFPIAPREDAEDDRTAAAPGIVVPLKTP